MNKRARTGITVIVLRDRMSEKTEGAISNM